MAVKLHSQDVRLKTAAFAFGAANEKIAQELHLDFSKPVPQQRSQRPLPELKENALALRPAPSLRVAWRRARELDRRSQIKNRRRTRGARERRLVDHHDFADAMRAADATCTRPLPLGRSSLCAKEISVKDFVDQGGFAGAGNAGHAGENAERNLDIDVLEIVLARAFDLERGSRLRRDFGIGIDFSPDK